MYLTVVSRPGDLHFAVHSFNVDEAALGVGLLDLPHSARESEPVAHGRYGGDRAYLLAALSYHKVLAVLENGVELIVSEKPLSPLPDGDLVFAVQREHTVFYHVREES